MTPTRSGPADAACQPMEAAVISRQRTQTGPVADCAASGAPSAGAQRRRPTSGSR